MKVLVISNNSFSSTFSNGKTLKSFFYNFSKDDLAQLYFGTNELPDTSCCSNYYRITEIDIFKSIFNMSFKTHNSYFNLLNAEYPLNKESKILKFIKNNSKTFAVFRELLWKFNTWDSHDLNLWISNYKPDIIFALLGDSIFVHNIVRKLSSRYKIPFVAYFTDDYFINDYSSNILQHLHYLILKHYYSQSINNSSYCYAIGDLMKNDYSRLFHKKFGVLVNSIDFSLYDHINPVKIDYSKQIVISFIGGIHLNRWKTIVQLGTILSEVNKEMNIDLVLKVFTSVEPSKNILDKFQYPIVFSGSLNYSEVVEQIEKSHFLLHVESFDKQNRLYTKYSVSTKIPEYLASKRAIIGFGPHEVASIKLLSDNNFGTVLTDLDSGEEIKNKLKNAIINYNNNDYSLLYEYALKQFDIKEVSSKLLNELETIIKK